MRFATIGTDSDLLAVAASLVDSGHVWKAAVVDSPAAEIEGPEAVLSEWDELFEYPTLEFLVLDAVSSDQRDEALRKLVQAGLPMLLLHPACEAIVAIELEMIRDDVGTSMATFCSVAHHPAFAALVALAEGEAEDIGELQQVVVERGLSHRTDESVLWNLRHDCELIRLLVGRIRHVNAMGEAGKGAGFSNLSVNMTSLRDVVVRWSVQPGENAASITLVGAKGQAKLTMQADGYCLATDNAEHQFDANLDLKETLSKLLQSDSTSPDWREIRHALEVAEAAERSAIKGKTIELFEETYSEEASFKGLMAMGGCGLLLLTLLFMIAWSIVEGVRLPYKRNEYERKRAIEQVDQDAAPVEQPQTHLLLRLWPVYPFVIFLLLQSLRLVFRAPVKEQSERGPPES